MRVETILSEVILSVDIRFNASHFKEYSEWKKADQNEPPFPFPKLYPHSFASVYPTMTTKNTFIHKRKYYFMSNLVGW